MKWFKHDGDALHDPKIEKLVMRYGIEGYGLYFACVEIIAGGFGPDNFTFELEHDAEILAYKFKVDTLKVEAIMKYCVELGLFEINTNNRITCMKLAKRLDNATTQNPELKATLRNFKELKETCSRLDKTRLEKNINTEESYPQPREDVYLSEYPPEFEEFCKAYPKHVEKARAYPPWKDVRNMGGDVSAFIKAAKNYAAYCKAEEREEKYIKAAHNWLKDDWRGFIEYKPRASPDVNGITVKRRKCPECGHVESSTSALCHGCGYDGDRWEEA